MIIFDNSICKMFLIILLILLTPWLSKKYSSKWIYYSWLIPIFGLLLPLNIPIKVNIICLNFPSFILHNKNTLINSLDFRLVHNTRINGSLIIGLVWLSGIGLVLVYHIVKHLRFRRLLNRWGEQIENDQYQQVLSRVYNDWKISKPIRLISSPCVTSPMLIGFIKPTILLPDTEFAEQELYFVLSHEMAHYKRKDLWYKSLLLLVTVIYWFNPLVYIMAKVVSIQCEISCDDLVLMHSDHQKRLHYSQTLIGLASYTGARTILGTNFYNSGENLKRRIYTIMENKKKNTGSWIFCTILILMILSGIQLTGKANTMAATESVVNQVNEERLTVMIDRSLLDKSSETIRTYVKVDPEIFK